MHSERDAHFIRILESLVSTSCPAVTDSLVLATERKLFKN